MEEVRKPKNVSVPLKTAEVWTKNYRDDVSSNRPNKKVDSYLVNRETLEKVLELNTSKVRVYVGVNDKKQNTLIFVGAELEEKSAIYRDVFGTDESCVEGEDSDIVFDFSEPNPPGKGDNKSPLN